MFYIVYVAESRGLQNSSYDWQVFEAQNRLNRQCKVKKPPFSSEELVAKLVGQVKNDVHNVELKVSD